MSACFQAYARDLLEAHEWCKKYQRTGNLKELTHAWDLYYHVFRRISKQLPQVCRYNQRFLSRLPQLQCAILIADDLARTAVRVTSVDGLSGFGISCAGNL